MADTKISNLTAATTLDGTEVLPVVQAGVTVKATVNQVRAGTLSNPMTTAGDIIYGGAGGTPTRLPIGSNGTVLGVSGGALTYIAAGGTGTVTSVSVATANGFAGSVATATTTPVITMTTSVTGMVKGNGTALSAATAGTDYSAGTAALATGILKSTTTTGALSIATPNTDYLTPPSGTAILKAGSGGALANATAGTDYSAGTSALSTGILKSTTGTGALTIAANSDLPAMSATVGGAVPTPPNDSAKFLNGQGVWAVPAGGGGGTQIVSFKNRLLNGMFLVDQRNQGASQTFTAGAALAYSVDRWYGYCTGANVTGQRVSGTAPDQYLYQFTGAASVTKIGFAQRIESVNIQDLAGTTATLSAYISNSLLTTVTWTAWYANTADTFGTLASPTRTQIATGAFTVTSTLTQYNAQISLPANTINGVEIELSVGAQTSGTWKIGRVQLESGSSATAFDVRPLTTETLLCQRYYFRYNASDTASSVGTLGQGFSQSTTAGRALIYFPIKMRLAPTALEQSGTATDYRVIRGSAGSAVCSAVPTFTNASVFAGDISWTVASGAIADQGVFFNFNASTGYLGWSAEL